MNPSELLTMLGLVLDGPSVLASHVLAPETPAPVNSAPLETQLQVANDRIAELEYKVDLQLNEIAAVRLENAELTQEIEHLQRQLADRPSTW